MPLNSQQYESDEEREGEEKLRIHMLAKGGGFPPWSVAPGQDQEACWGIPFKWTMAFMLSLQICLRD